MIFTIASLLCGMARNLGEMVVFRVLQGAGGGGIVPISQALMMESFPKEKRGTAMSVFGMGVIIAPIVGPVLGGWITDNWSWPWIFFINVPFGCLAAILASKMLYNPPYSHRQKDVKIDGLGFFFLTMWLLCLQVFLIKVIMPIGSMQLGFAGYSVYLVFQEFYFRITNFQKNTLVDLTVFKDRNFIIGTFIQVVMQAVLYASLAILPQFLQSMMGYTAF